MLLIKFRKLILSLTVVLIALGAYSYYAIPKQELPDLSVPYSFVTISAPGYNSEEVDNDIIMQFKSDIMSLPDIDVTHSYAFDNYGLLIVGFEIGVSNPNDLNDEVANIIGSKSFTDEIEITIDSDFSVTDIMYAFPTSKIEDAKNFEEHLMRLDEVEKVMISDYNNPFYEVIVDTNAIANYGLNIEMIGDIITSNGMDYTLGYLNDKSIITKNKFSSLEELESMMVFNTQDGSVKLKDIAKISKVSSENYFNLLNGEDVLFMSIYFSSDIDITTMGDEIRNIAKNYSGFEEVSFFPDDVEKSIDEISSTLFVGMAIVLVVVLFGLGLRSSIVILIAFPFTSLSTIFTLYILGLELQNISIAGLIISIGIIVDNAIVIIDAIKHNIGNNHSMEKSISKSIKDNSIAILTSTLTTIVAFTPLLFLPGVAGQMASTLPLTVIIALVYSYIVAILVIPIIASKVLKTNLKTREFKISKIIRHIINKPKVVVFLSIFLLITSVIGVIYKQQIKLFPSAEKEYIIVDYTNNKNTGIDDMKKISDLITSYIDSDFILSAANYKIPSFYTTLSDNLVSPNTGRIIYKFNGNNSQEIRNLSKKLKKSLGTDISVSIYELELNDPGVPIEVLLYDTDRSEEIANKVNALESIDSVDVSKINDVNSYVIRFNEDYIIKNNIFKGKIEKQIALILNDKELSVVDNEEVDDSLILRSGVKEVEDLLNQRIVIDNKSFNISDLISIDEIVKPYSINRHNFNEVVTLSTFISDRYSIYAAHNDVVDLLETENANYDLYGEVKLTKSIFNDVLFAGVVAFFVIFAILLGQFRHFKNIIVIMSTIFLSFIGSALALMIFSQDITFSVTIGLVSLMGIVVNNGILLLDYISKSTEINTIEKCLDAIDLRSRAIIISNVTTVSGLIPLIIFGNKFFRPMAITMAGGMMLAVPLSLIVLPSLYVLLNKKN